MMMQKRRGMDIKQMKTFVSEELKGLKQEHRLLSLREYSLNLRHLFLLQHQGVFLSLRRAFFHRYRCLRVNNEEENQAGLPGAVED